MKRKTRSAKKQKIAITGAKGLIGSVLMKNLKRDYEITPIDLPEIDVRDFEKLKEILRGKEIVIHLAWSWMPEEKRNGEINLDNFLITFNVYRASTEAKVKRVIMASSVHADSYLNYEDEGKKLLKPDKVPIPSNPYGASKVYMEALGRYYGKYKELEVICLRFGGVNKENTPKVEKMKERLYDKVWFSHQDLVSLIKVCIEAKKIPNNFLIIYGISNNKGRIHDSSNPFGWKPKDDSSKYK